MKPALSQHDPNKNYFVLDPAYTYFAPGITAIKPETLNLPLYQMFANAWWTALITIPLFICLGLWLAENIVSDWEYSVFGKPVTVQVIQCQMVNNGKFEVPEFEYVYEVNQIRYENQTTGSGRCGLLPVGEQLDALYLSNNPAQSRIIDEHAVPSASAQLAIMTFPLVWWLMLLLNIVLLFAPLVKYTLGKYRIYCLMKYSTLIEGELLGTKRLPQRYTTSQLPIQVQYRFTTPNGQMIIGEQKTYRTLFASDHAEHGTPVLVLYASRRNYVML